ncbi:tetraspanin-33 isoform X3 [Poecilia latipinna]|uniref:tetraspanin-33 isoform X3 n=1 Tax=Poecilia latipinna TaxID=48699 RepID=UPI00072DE105|nr:PREDICTED: tetraspanin-33-like isoform X3 [Poecilia latipinna]XP_014878888.1 PREDICTED: tetraspanin-33-like isoform X3 [Poecilia latipinna]
MVKQSANYLLRFPSPWEPSEMNGSQTLIVCVCVCADVVDTLTVDPALLLIVVGLLMFLITFLGCFGALRNATCLLKMFLSILAVVLVLQVAAGAVTYVLTDLVTEHHELNAERQRSGVNSDAVQVMERTEMLMMKAVVRYREDRDLENAIDFVQKKFQCCGVENYKDWSRNVYFECSESNPSLEVCGVPFSCCVHLQNQTVLNTMCGYGMQQQQEAAARQHIFTPGCLQRIVLWAQKNLLLVAGLTAGLLLLEVCMMGLAAAQAAWIHRVRRRQKVSEGRRAEERKERLWFPAFADFTEE